MATQGYKIAHLQWSHVFSETLERVSQTNQKPKKKINQNVQNLRKTCRFSAFSGLLCDVCNRSIPRRPGKQGKKIDFVVQIFHFSKIPFIFIFYNNVFFLNIKGYECRDCQLKCHKQCHVRTPQACTNPTVLSMEL